MGSQIYVKGGASCTPSAKKNCTRSEYFTMSNGVFNFNFLALVVSKILEGPNFTLGSLHHMKRGTISMDILLLHLLRSNL